MSYDIKAFRTIRAKTEKESAYCRHCDWQTNDCLESKGVKSRARYHAKINLHTVDVYSDMRTEYTCHVKDLIK